MPFQLNPIGVIHSPHEHAAGTPIQPSWAEGAEGYVEIDPALALGLRDLEGMERIWLIYWFDRAGPASLEVVPFMDDKSHGIFATRAPTRPNPIGMSSVRLLGIEGARLRVSGLDMLDGTPLLDIKPYLPSADVFAVQGLGWYAQAHGSGKADGRFEK
ncbi:tRNA-Thr(GGU) m(6)t(6)A37 methyltransferase TsaA [Rhizomicrobium palustre]|uniref:tRNA-Thr(GGU) m(6)t(6)A37 methyltransferase TsaA n=1 Tax=Rhizomicrobium palustre TaxID=189966 RepID=A0A846MYS1_9PROT|nr:tRNA (N6-threonylcarbamoyladenosine(37)-N6)-methyltransferase TrmO [Rhizomicrobium palustre]NIK88778.1 tRNA-Thr(GGU) m(6)t(6)A37 methyltransferase TsaA [Rhizomicrobium palustre]